MALHDKEIHDVARWGAGQSACSNIQLIAPTEVSMLLSWCAF